MAHRTVDQQDQNRPTPPAEGDVEVVTADGTRKAASLPQLAKRMADGVRNLTSMTDERPPWLPGELADPIAVTGNSDGDDTPQQNVATAASQPPQATLVASRGQHSANITRIAEQTGEWVAQLVDMDRKARYRVYDIGRIVALLALGNDALTQLETDGWANVNPALIGEFAAEVDGWKADRGIA